MGTFGKDAQIEVLLGQSLAPRSRVLYQLQACISPPCLADFECGEPRREWTNAASMGQVLLLIKWLRAEASFPCP